MTVTYAKLNWPRHKPRTQAVKRKRAAFNQSNGRGWKVSVTMANALSRLHGQIDVLDRKYHTDYTLTLDTPFGQQGRPLANRRTPDDCGAAVYFDLNKRPIVLACDKWDRVEDNIIAISKHIEALRGQERWGVATVEEAFAGHIALPAPMTMGAHWTTVLNLPADATPERIKLRYRSMAKQQHTDTGGDHDHMAALNVAKDEALKERA